MSYYYDYFRGHGRRILADALFADDPFALAPAEIVGRVLDAGYCPEVACPRCSPWPTSGRLTEVQIDDTMFLVAVSRDKQDISVQEVRSEAYNAIA